MKKIIFTYIFVLIFSFVSFAQAIVTDSKSIPFDLSLDQVLRVGITSGGNIEFVFNTINQYNAGIVNSSFYNTSVQVASSSNWQLHLGAEGNLTGTDDPADIMDKNNVGFTVTWIPVVNSCCAAGDQVSSITGTYDDAPTGVANGLALFTGAVGDILFTKGGVGTNAGDINDNKFIIHWECGTKGAGKTPMNANSMLQPDGAFPFGRRADRYITTVFIELEAL